MAKNNENHKRVENNIIIKDAVVINRNFGGRAQRYNDAGERNFSVILDEETANVLIEDGWKVSVKTNPEDPDAEARYYMSVNVKYNEFGGPTIMQITKRNGKFVKTPITEDTVKLLDGLEMKNISLELRPYNWFRNGQSGVKAYLKTMYYELVEDPFAAMYDDFEDDISELPFEE